MLSKEHQLFLQQIMRKKLVPWSEIHALIASCKTAVRVEAAAEKDVDGYLKTVNLAIKPYNMQIYKVADEEEGRVYLGLVNILDSELSRSTVSFHKKQHLEFFKRVVTAVIRSDDGLLSPTKAVNLALELPDGSKMTIVEAENLLEEWIREKYFTESKESNQIYCGVKLIMEFRQYIKVHFADWVDDCNLCRNVSVRGMNCPKCNSKFHYHCAENCLRDGGKCPQCKERWSSDMIRI